MKTRLTILKLLVVLCCTFATTVVFGQLTTYTWTNRNPVLLLGGVGDLGVTTNWSPNGVPIGNIGPDGNGIFGDTMVWDGQTTHDLLLTETGTAVGAGGQNQAAGFGNPTGIHLHLTSNQTNSVTVYSVQSPASSGWRFSDLIIDGPGGSWSFGTNSSANQHLDIVTGGQPGQIHNFINNSTNAARVNQDVRWRAGGGGAHTYVFDGTGDWIINHDMIGANNSPNVITKTGSGTMTWFYAKTDSGQNSSLQGPQTISGGLQIRKNAGLFPTIVQAVQNDSTLRWDASSDSDSFGGTLSGVGLLQVTSGTLSLGGPNTFTGNISLSGGELIANSGENPGVNGPFGVGGTITLNGGILGFGNNNFDYSSRFDTGPGQQYLIDTRGQSVTFSKNLATSGGSILTKHADATLTRPRR